MKIGIRVLFIFSLYLSLFWYSVLLFSLSSAYWSHTDLSLFPLFSPFPIFFFFDLSVSSRIPFFPPQVYLARFSHLAFLFLDGSIHLYMKVCLSVRQSVSRSVNCFFFGQKWTIFSIRIFGTFQLGHCWKCWICFMCLSNLVCWCFDTHQSRMVSLGDHGTHTAPKARKKFENKGHETVRYTISAYPCSVFLGPLGMAHGGILVCL